MKIAKLLEVILALTQRLLFLIMDRRQFMGKRVAGKI